MLVTRLGPYEELPRTRSSRGKIQPGFVPAARTNKKDCSRIHYSSNAPERSLSRFKIFKCGQPCDKHEYLSLASWRMKMRHARGTNKNYDFKFIKWKRDELVALVALVDFFFQLVIKNDIMIATNHIFPPGNSTGPVREKGDGEKNK